MCDERERLIGYIYDECEADEQRTVERHLDECPTCRAEVQALRGVRADLLAWEVKGSPDVWRPFPAPVGHAWWRQVPAWALAAAAGLVLTAGFGGGVAARAWAPAQSSGVTPPAAVAVDATAVTPADLAEAQERILALVKFELDQRSRRDGLAQNVRLAAMPNAQTAREMSELSRASDENFKAVTLLYEDLLKYRERTDARLKELQRSVDSLNFAINSGR